MFEGWGEYYLLIGTVGATLIGLLFVVATLRSSGNAAAEQGARVFITPTVWHLAVVLGVSGVALAPDQPVPAIAALVGAAALWGFAAAAWIVFTIVRPAPPKAAHWSDVWCYGVAPLAAYAALLASAAALLLAPHTAAQALAASLMLLLLVAIRNAWDLVTWLAPRAETKG